MRARTVAFGAVALVLVAAGSAVGPAAVAGGTVVKSVVEGRDSESGRIVLWVIGSGVSKLKSFTLTTPTGVFVSDEFETVYSSKTMIGVRLSASIGPGNFKLSMATSSTASPEVRNVSLTAGLAATSTTRSSSAVCARASTRGRTASSWRRVRR
jgi:hypothetical protein